MFLPMGEKQAGIAAAVPRASQSLSEDMQAVDEQVCFLLSNVICPASVTIYHLIFLRVQ